VKVLTEYLEKDSFLPKDIPLVKRAISHTKGAWHIGVMRDHKEVKGAKLIVKHFRSALSYNPTLWYNRGAWVFLFARLIGLKINRNSRFKKNEK